MSGKTKADLQAEIESLRKLVAEQSAVLSEGEAKNSPGDVDHRLVQIRDAIECLDAGFVLYANNIIYRIEVAIVKPLFFIHFLMSALY